MYTKRSTLILSVLSLCFAHGPTMGKSSDCRCISPGTAWPDQTLTHKAGILGINATTYGYGCRAHDENRSVCDDRTRPVYYKWCNSQWCYVDETCGVASYPAPRTSSESTIGPLGFTAQRTISYAVCKGNGIQSPYFGNMIEHGLRGKTLRAAVLGTQLGGWVFPNKVKCKQNPAAGNRYHHGLSSV